MVSMSQLLVFYPILSAILIDSSTGSNEIANCAVQNGLAFTLGVVVTTLIAVLQAALGQDIRNWWVCRRGVGKLKLGAPLNEEEKKAINLYEQMKEFKEEQLRRKTERKAERLANKMYDEAEAAKRNAAIAEQKLNAVLAEKHFKQALKSYSQGNYRLALAKIEKAAGLCGNSSIYNFQGYIYDEMGRYMDAIHAYKLAKEQKEIDGLSDVVNIDINLGNVYMSIGSFAEALASYQSAEKTRQELGFPEDPDLIMNLGNVYDELGDPIAAMESFEKAKRLREDQRLPIDPKLTMNIGSVHWSMQEYDKALNCYIEAEQQFRDMEIPEHLMLAMNRGEANRALGHWDKAIEDYQIALKNHLDRGIPPDPAIYGNMALAMGAKGDLEEACRIGKKAYDLCQERSQQMDEELLIFLSEHCPDFAEAVCAE